MFIKKLIFISITICLSLLFVSRLNAQDSTSILKQPVEWSFKYQRISKNQIALITEAKVLDSWYLPAQKIVQAGMDSNLVIGKYDFSMQILPNLNAETVEELKASHLPEVWMGVALASGSPNLNFYKKKVQFVQIVEIKNPNKVTKLQGYIFYNQIHPKLNPSGFNSTLRSCFKLVLHPNDMPVLSVAQECDCVKQVRFRD